MNRVAFTLPDVGLREIRGMAYVDEGFLVLRIEDKLLGLIDPEKHVVKIEPGALRDVRVKKGLFRDRLVIEPKGMELLDLIPGEHPVAVELRVKRKFRPYLMGLFEEIEALL